MLIYPFSMLVNHLYCCQPIEDRLTTINKKADLLPVGSLPHGTCAAKLLPKQIFLPALASRVLHSRDRRDQEISSGDSRSSTYAFGRLIGKLLSRGLLKSLFKSMTPHFSKLLCLDKPS